MKEWTHRQKHYIITLKGKCLHPNLNKQAYVYKNHLLFFSIMWQCIFWKLFPLIGLVKLHQPLCEISAKSRNSLIFFPLQNLFMLHHKCYISLGKNYCAWILQLNYKNIVTWLKRPTHELGYQSILIKIVETAVAFTLKAIKSPSSTIHIHYMMWYVGNTRFHRFSFVS